MLPVILASASPRRRELLERIGVDFEVAGADIDESTRPGEGAVDYVRRLAREKAEHVARARAAGPAALVLGADTTVTCGGDILGKAHDADEARAMLERLVGARHEVVTGFALVGPEDTTVGHAVTEVVMRRPTAAELDGYLASGEWRGKAGAYAVQGIAAAFVREIRGSITNVIGLPLAEVIEVMVAAGGPAPRLDRGHPA